MLRSSSLLRSFTRSSDQGGAGGGEGSNGGNGGDQVPEMIALNAELLERLYKITVPREFDESLHRVFFKDRPADDRIHPPTKDTAAGGGGGGGIATSPRSRQLKNEEEEGIHSGNNYL